MNMFLVHEQSVTFAPFKNTFEVLYGEHLNHYVQFSSFEIGFLLKPNIAIAPSSQRHDCEVITGDGEKTTAKFLAVHKGFNYSLFYIKKTPIQETMTFRRKPVRHDTFLFRLDVASNLISICTPTPAPEVNKLTIRYEHISDFLPVFDRFGHFVGMSFGRYNKHLVCAEAYELNNLVQWSKQNTTD